MVEDQASELKGGPDEESEDSPLSGSLIVVFKPDDIVFAQIVAKLDFDNRQRPIRTIAEPVICLWRNMDVLAFMQLYFSVATDDVCGSFNDDPVLAAMGMALQAQARARLNLKHFNLEASPFFQHLIAAPGTFVRLSQQSFPPRIKFLMICRA